MRASRTRCECAGLGSLLALLVLVVALTPGAQASSRFTSCADEPITFQIEDSKGKKMPYSLVVKAISVKGASCAKAYEFFHLLYDGRHHGGAPQHYTCTSGDFHVPSGYVPVTCAKPGKTIRYAAQGG